MAIASTDSLVDILRKSFLLTRAQMDELSGSLQDQFQDPTALAKEMQRRGWLTSYQVDHLLHGDPAALLLGEYVILQPVGEGSMGHVFKARHRLMNRIVAIKIVRKELLSDREAVERFRREIHTAAQLSHPNVVAAFDAAQIGDIQLLVMEYVEGMDLGQMVQENGPLPVETAADYVRQAALGLQHAHERGLIHRDIKPVNLLVAAKGGVVKILDLGLARLQSSHTNLTQEGALIGTPAYIAPEQGLDSHQADIRSDIYSLGCVFYYLLSGQMPFYGESLAKVLVKHLFEEPTPIEHLRFEVPKGLAAVLRKMMAKNLQDRYQTPAEVAEALVPWSVAGEGAAPRPDSSPPRQAPLAPMAPPPARSARASVNMATPALPPQKPAARPKEASSARAPVATSTRTPSSTATRRPPVDTKRTMTQEAPGASRSFGSTAWRPTATGKRRGARGLFVLGAMILGGGGLVAVGVLIIAFVMSPTAAPVSTSTQTVAPTSRTEVAGPSASERPVETGNGRPHKDRLAPWVAKRSILDDLDLAAIPKEIRKELGDRLPPQAVAVLGTKGRGQISASIAFTPDGKRLASIDQSSNVVLWDVINQSSVTLPSPAGRVLPINVNAVAVSPDGQLLAASSWEGKVYLWSLPADGKIPEPAVVDAHKNVARAVAFSPDSKTLASAGSHDKTVKLWDLTQSPPTLIRTLSGHDRGVLLTAFDPLGPTLASGGAEGNVCLWDLRAATPKIWDTLRGPTKDVQISSLAFSPDGNLIAVVGSDEKVRLWDLTGATPKELPPLEGHVEKVRTVCFSADGKTLATAESWPRVIVWDLATRKPRPGLEWDKEKVPYLPSVLAFAADGRHLAIGSTEGPIYILRLARPTVD